MKKEVKKLKVGDTVLYFTNNKSLVDKTEVVNIDKKLKSGILKNGIRVSLRFDKSKELMILNSKYPDMALVWGSKAKKIYNDFTLEVRYKKLILSLQKLNYKDFKGDKEDLINRLEELLNTQ